MKKRVLTLINKNLKLVAVVVLVILAACIITPKLAAANDSPAMAAEKEYLVVLEAKGKMDGFEYKYKLQPHGHRELYLTDPNGVKIRIWKYIGMDGGVFGDDINDSYTIKEGNSGIEYAKEYTGIINNWNGEILPRAEGMKRGAAILAEWEEKIRKKHIKQASNGHRWLTP